MDRNRDKNDNGPFNAHTGAAFGLIIGLVLGSLLLNLPAVAAPSALSDSLRSAMQMVVGSIATASAQLGS